MLDNNATHSTAAPGPPVTIERPRGPVRSSLFVRPLVTSSISLSIVPRVTFRSLKWPTSGRRCRSIRLRSRSKVDGFLLAHPSARYSSNNAFIVGSSFASSRARAGSLPPSDKAEQARSLSARSVNSPALSMRADRQEALSAINPGLEHVNRVALLPTDPEAPHIAVPDRLPRP